MKDELLNETLEKTKEQIKTINESGINESNLMHLDKLVDIYKDIKEVECMYSGNYGYGNYSGRDVRYSRGNDYGNYGEYGRRGYDARYRGDESLDRMYGEYGRYQESRNRYGHGEETDKSFHYMVKSLEDFIKVLYEEAESPQQKQELMQVLQSSMR